MKYEKSFKYLCNLMWNRPDVNKRPVEIIIEDVKKEFPSIADFQLHAFHQHLKKNFLQHYTSKWQSVCRNRKRFLTKYEKFMHPNYNFEFPTSAPAEKIKNKGGRPRKDWKDLSETSRHRRLKKMISLSELKNTDGIDAYFAKMPRLNKSLYEKMIIDNKKTSHSS